MAMIRCRGRGDDDIAKAKDGYNNNHIPNGRQYDIKDYPSIASITLSPSRSRSPSPPITPLVTSSPSSITSVPSLSHSKKKKKRRRRIIATAAAATATCAAAAVSSGEKVNDGTLLVVGRVNDITDHTYIHGTNGDIINNNSITINSDDISGSDSDHSNTNSDNGSDNDNDNDNNDSLSSVRVAPTRKLILPNNNDNNTNNDVKDTDTSNDGNDNDNDGGMGGHMGLSIMPPVGSPVFGSAPSVSSPGVSLNDKIEQSLVEAAEAEAAAAAAAAADSLEPFLQLCGPLFVALQSTVGTGRTVLRDSKTFPDAIARSSVERILTLYQAQSLLDDFDLNAFMLEHFILPEGRPLLRAGETHTAKWASSPVLSTVEEHICTMWNRLTRRADAANEAGQRGTLLRLPHAYIVPGGRFREIYYWDSYFTCLGLSASDIPSHSKLIRAMTDNFSFVIDTYGHIPNGNRQYYRSRSQPPFFCHLVQLLCQQTPNRGLSLMDRYAPRIEKEYRFWMNGSDAVSRAHPCHRRVVLVFLDGDNEAPLLLNRYWDDSEGTPRPEAWVQDTELAHAAIAGVDEEHREAARNAAFRHIRAAAESGWDFSSRWFSDGRDMKTICTTDIIPVDLNCLLLHMEYTLSQYYSGIDIERARDYEMAATRRRNAIHRLFWNRDRSFFFDFNIVTMKQMDIWTLAGAFPLWVGATECSSEQAKSMAVTLKSKFLQSGGWVTTWRDDDLVTGQQWDYPNGWAPLQWIVTQGLRSHGEKGLAMLGANRWLATNRLIFRRTHKMMEKYNVVDLALEGGGGEYSLQTGFGWTNGVYSAIQALNETDKSSLTCAIPLSSLSPRVGLHGNDSPYNGSPSKRRAGPSSRALGSISGSTTPLVLPLQSSSLASVSSLSSMSSSLPLDVIEQLPSLSLTDNATITSAFTCAPSSVHASTSDYHSKNSNNDMIHWNDSKDHKDNNDNNDHYNDTKRLPPNNIGINNDSNGGTSHDTIDSNGEHKYNISSSTSYDDNIIASIQSSSSSSSLSRQSPSSSPSPTPPLVVPSSSSSSPMPSIPLSLSSSMNILASISLRGVVPSPSISSISSLSSLSSVDDS